MCLIWHPCPNKRFPLKTRWDQVLTLKFRSMSTVSCWVFFDRKIIDNMASNVQLTVLPLPPNMIKSNGSLVFCLKDQNWERKRERQRGACVCAWEGGMGVRAREREKRETWEKKREESFDKFQIVPYTSTLFTTLYVGQGQILFFFFKVHIIALSNQQKTKLKQSRERGQERVGFYPWIPSDKQTTCCSQIFLIF